MNFASLLFLLGAVALFGILPLFALAGSWRKLEPGTRRALLVLYLVVLAMIAGLVVAIRRWADSGL